MFSSVILQREKFVKKVRDIIQSLNRRLDLWCEGKFDLLVQEASRCDRSFRSRQRRKHNKEHIEKIFTRLMLSGKVRAAMRWLTERTKGSVLHPNDTIEMIVDNNKQQLSVIEALKVKHPDSHQPHSSTLLNVASLPLLEDIEVTGAHIGLVARKIQGSAGPGGCDSSHWQDILCRFGRCSRGLCDAIADLTSHLANSQVDWPHIQALLSNRLIALDKSPGIRPIGVGETLRRIIGKAVCLVTRDDAETVCEARQLCAGLKCGIEGAIHAATDLFESHDDSYGMLIMDARNAFNSINRISLLWNIRILWPRASRFIFNTYRGRSPLILKGCNEILQSSEGIVQGDPLSMFMYAVATLPLIDELEDYSSCIQLWYADDSSAFGNITSVLTWFEKLLRTGPRYGYFPEPNKCYLIVKGTMISQAMDIFSNTGVNVVTSCRFLGGCIGDEAGKISYISEKVQEWANYVDLLSSIAKNQPQAAYIALTRSLQHEWIFLQRVIKNCGHLFQMIEDTLSSQFIPNLFGHDCINYDRQLYSLPTKMGGLNIRIPTSTADLAYNASRAATRLLIESIKRSSSFSLPDHESTVLESRSDFHTIKHNIDNQLLTCVLNQVDSTHQRSIIRHKQSLSCWLNALPILRDHFDLSAVEFRDALCVRYLKPLLQVPSKCDGCGDLFTTSHALDCRKGGLVIQRHNEIRDLISDLSSIVWSQVVKEPLIGDESSNNECLKADIGIRGAWQSQSMSLFDVRVLDSDAPSYLQRNPEVVLRNAEREKKLKYIEVCERRHATFTPLCVTVDGLVGPEMSLFLKRLADRISSKWDQQYATTLHWLRTKLSFALVRATDLCIRGSRSKWRGLGIEDGLGINHYFL